jgi:hypothetical protein
MTFPVGTKTNTNRAQGNKQRPVPCFVGIKGKRHLGTRIVMVVLGRLHVACLRAWLPGCLAAWLPGCLHERTAYKLIESLRDFAGLIYSAARLHTSSVCAVTVETFAEIEETASSGSPRSYYCTEMSANFPLVTSAARCGVIGNTRLGAPAPHKMQS